jgi:two-component system, cell cycle sensor histidine kinase and response regulator CckA
VDDSQGAMRSVRVLIVEDSEDDALLVANELRRGGIEATPRRVDSAAGLQAALAGEAPEIVIVDHNLPGFGGIAALRMIRAFDPDLPVILISGAVGEDVLVEAMKSGGRDFILKGNLTRLVPAVRRELEEAQTRRDSRLALDRVRFQAQVLEQVGEAIVAVDLDETVTYWNPAAERLFGVLSSEALGRGVREVIPASVFGSEEEEDARFALMAGGTGATRWSTCGPPAGRSR